MIVEKTDSEVIIRLPLDIGSDKLEHIENYLKYAEAVKASIASEKETVLLAEESKKIWWEENKNKFIK